EIIEQRQRVLMATLNGVTAIYQRMDVILTTFDTTLIRLRSIHSNRVSPVPNFESRYASLRAELDSLHTQSNQVATEITACQGGVDLSACVQSSRVQSSDLLISLRKFFASYRALALDVIH
ncbi:MAG: hypothetical protein AABX02_02325, partial [archaeon]